MARHIGEYSDEWVPPGGYATLNTLRICNVVHSPRGKDFFTFFFFFEHYSGVSITCSSVIQSLNLPLKLSINLGSLFMKNTNEMITVPSIIQIGSIKF